MRGVKDTKSSANASRYFRVFNQNDDKGEFIKQIGLESKIDL